jgi:hypothetical protein
MEEQRGRGFRTSVVQCVPEIATAVDSLMTRRPIQFLAHALEGKVSDCRLLRSWGR